jgi:hypothetical protein
MRRRRRAALGTGLRAQQPARVSAGDDSMPTAWAALQGPRGELQRTFHPLVRLEQVRALRVRGQRQAAGLYADQSRGCTRLAAGHAFAGHRQAQGAEAERGRRQQLLSPAGRRPVPRSQPPLLTPPPPPACSTGQDGNAIKVIKANESRQANQQHGLARSLLSNMVVGVDTGFTTTLQASGAAARPPAAPLGLPASPSPPLVLAAGEEAAAGAAPPASQPSCTVGPAQHPRCSVGLLPLSLSCPPPLGPLPIPPTPPPPALACRR